MRVPVRPPVYHRWARHSVFLRAVLKEAEGRPDDDPEVVEFTELVRAEVKELDDYYGHTEWSPYREEV